MKKILTSICNPETYEHFYREHAAALRNFILFKFGSADDAEDVTQEAFIQLWKNCEKVTIEKAKAFLYTTAKNLSISLKRHDKVKLDYKKGSLGEDKNVEDPEFSLLEQEFRSRLQQAIAQLPDRQREAFLLNRVEKKTYNEIAELMDVSVKAIEKLMHKALLKIRKEIGDLI